MPEFKQFPKNLYLPVQLDVGYYGLPLKQD